MVMAPTENRSLRASPPTAAPVFANTFPRAGQSRQFSASRPSTPRMGRASRKRLASGVPCQYASIRTTARGVARSAGLPPRPSMSSTCRRSTPARSRKPASTGNPSAHWWLPVVTASRQMSRLAPRLWLTLRISLAYCSYGGEVYAATRGRPS